MFELIVRWREHGEWKETFLDNASSMYDATLKVEGFHDRWRLFCESGGDLSALHWSNPLRHFEGGEICLVNLKTGEGWVYDSDEDCSWTEL